MAKLLVQPFRKIEMVKKKLDLINSRLNLARDSNAVYDSLEGESVSKFEPSIYSLGSVGFRSTTKQHREEPKSAAPNIFNRAHIDNSGNVVEMSRTLSKKVIIEQKDVVKPTNKLENQKPEEKFYAPSLDLIKDQIYQVPIETLASRVRDGKVTGAIWTKSERFVNDNSTLDYDYDKNRFENSRFGGNHKFSAQFNSIPTDRGLNDPNEIILLPIKERRRLERVEQSNLKYGINKTKTATTNSVDNLLSSSPDNKHQHTSNSTYPPDISLNYSTTQDNINKVPKFSKSDRFNSPMYKQESYVKTNGMLLANDWDKRLDTKMEFRIRDDVQDASSKLMASVNANKSLGGDVDVDVGHMFSMVTLSNKSPIKYSAAFRSSAEVGMEIRPTTSPDYIGPGSFPGAFPSFLQVNRPEWNSYFMLRDRKFPTRKARPENSEQIKTFSEQHTHGPIISKQSEMNGNIVLQNIVKSKMTQIYPRLAKIKFPPKDPIIQKRTKKRK